MLLLIWFSSDAFIEYVKLFKLHKLKLFERFLRTEEYKLTKEELAFVVNYSDFLFTKQDEFLSKLLSCQYCFSFWSSILINLSYCKFFDFQITEGLLLFPITYVASLFVFKRISTLG